MVSSLTRLEHSSTSSTRCTLAKPHVKQRHRAISTTSLSLKARGTHHQLIRKHGNSSTSPLKCAEARNFLLSGKRLVPRLTLPQKLTQPLSFTHPDPPRLLRVCVVCFFIVPCGTLPILFSFSSRQHPHPLIELFVSGYLMKLKSNNYRHNLSFTL